MCDPNSPRSESSCSAKNLAAENLARHDEAVAQFQQRAAQTEAFACAGLRRTPRPTVMVTRFPKLV